MICRDRGAVASFLPASHVQHEDHKGRQCKVKATFGGSGCRLIGEENRGSEAMPFLEEWRAEPKLAMNALKQLSSWPMAVVQMIEMIKAVRVQVDHFHCGVAINACQTRWRTAMYVLSLMLLACVETASERL
jgi:hypothetical protein